MQAPSCNGFAGLALQMTRLYPQVPRPPELSATLLVWASYARSLKVKLWVQRQDGPADSAFDTFADGSVHGQAVLEG